MPEFLALFPLETHLLTQSGSALGITLEHLRCPITSQLMVDPVVAQDGYTYERSAIEWHFQAHSQTKSPVTGLAMAGPALLPNRTLAKATANLSTSRNKVGKPDACIRVTIQVHGSDVQHWNGSEGYASLPDELLRQIFARLDGVSLARQGCLCDQSWLASNTMSRLCQVCQSFNRFIHNNSELWQRVCRQTLPSAQYLLCLRVRMDTSSPLGQPPPLICCLL